MIVGLLEVYIQLISIVIYKYKSKSMLGCLKNFFRNFTLRSDLFAAPATLRYSGQTTYESYCGGILSILLVIGFGVVFYSSFVDVLTKVVINASTDMEVDPYNSHKVSDFQFAVGIQGLDFRETQRYFDFVITHYSRPLGQQPTQTILEMEACDKANWENVGDHFDKLFEHHEMEKMLCPKEGEPIELEGFAGSETWQFLMVKVEKCVNHTANDWTCHPQVDIDTFMSLQQNSSDYFQVNIFVVDTIFSPLKEEYVIKKMEQQIFLTFSQHSGSRGIIKIGDYNITTDHSIWPVQDTTQEIGHYIVDYSTHTVDLFSTHYVKVLIEKDQTVYTLQRAHGKFDEMLSYVGGLFSLLFAFIVFFIGSYSQYLYELGVAGAAFTYDESGRKISEKKFHFFTFLKYSIYDWITSLGCSMSWKQMEMINEAKQEANQQLDVRFLIKKMQRFERVNEILLKERNLICSQLMAPPTLQKIKRLRKITQYYDKVIKDEEVDRKAAKVMPESDMANDKQLCEESLDSFNKEDALKDDQIPSDFDSEDQEIQKQILASYNSLKQDKQDKLASSIYENIPKKMKKRLHQLQIKESFEPEKREAVFSANNTKNDLNIGGNTNTLMVKNLDL